MGLTIEGVALTNPQHVYVIAEASANHCRDHGKARALVEAAHEAGADAVKFQTFTAERIAAPGITIPRGIDPAQDAWLDRIGATTLRDVLADGGLPWKWHEDLQALAQQCGMTFLSTPFSVDDAKFLVETLHVPALKIASGDITFAPLLRYAGQAGIPVILSTGASRYIDIVLALEWLGMEDGYAPDVALLHCVSAYPCPVPAINIARLLALQGEQVCGAYGLSDHTLSVDIVPAMAVGAGATVYEKHLRLDAGVSVDTDHSLAPEDFRVMVQTLRTAGEAMGKGWIQERTPQEAHEVLWMRRSPTDWLRPTEAAREGQWA